MAMGSRYAARRHKTGMAKYRLLEVVVVRNSPDREKVLRRVLSIDNHYDTLQVVQENLSEFITNMVRVNFGANRPPRSD
jgi:hypothetical protein